MKPLIGVGIALAIIAVAVAAGSFAGQPRPQTVNYEQRVVDLCEVAVKAQLKAPATAVFPSQDETTITGPTIDVQSNLWRYFADVDSENSFGANIRTSFSCTVTPDFASTTVELL